MARRKGARDEYVVQVMLNYIDRLGLVKAEMRLRTFLTTERLTMRGESKIEQRQGKWRSN